MTEAQEQRKRRIATYGKTKKRLSATNELFFTEPNPKSVITANKIATPDTNAQANAQSGKQRADTKTQTKSLLHNKRPTSKEITAPKKKENSPNSPISDQETPATNEMETRATMDVDPSKIFDIVSSEDDDPRPQMAIGKKRKKLASGAAEFPSLDLKAKFRDAHEKKKKEISNVGASKRLRVTLVTAERGTKSVKANGISSNKTTKSGTVSELPKAPAPPLPPTNGMGNPPKEPSSTASSQTAMNGEPSHLYPEPPQVVIYSKKSQNRPEKVNTISKKPSGQEKHQKSQDEKPVTPSVPSPKHIPPAVLMTRFENPFPQRSSLANNLPPAIDLTSDSPAEQRPPEEDISLVATANPNTEKSNLLDAFDLGEPESQPPARRKRLIDRLAPGPNKSQKKGSVSSDSEDEEEHRALSPFPGQIPQREDDYGVQQSQIQIPPNPEQNAGIPTVKPLLNNGRAGPRITYARQRSFKADEPLTENELFNTPLVIAQQFSSSRQIDTGLDGEEENSRGMMKSIHELREAGVNSRFLDDLEDLFEDFRDNVPLGRRRSGYLELASKMRDKTYVHKFRANGFDDRLVANLSQQTDEIICFTLSYILWCLLNEDTSVQVISKIHAKGGIPMLVRMLDVDRDIRIICKDRKTNMSKAAQGLIVDIRDLVEKSSLFAEKKPKLLSPRIMGLKVLESAIRKLKETEVKENILPLDGAKKLVGILAKFAAPQEDSQFKRLDTLLLELSVSILESYTIGDGVPAEQQLSAPDYMTIAGIFSSVSRLEWPQEQLNHIQFLTLRTILNMSNNQNTICDMFADSSLVPDIIEHIRNKFVALSGPLELEKRIVEVDLLILGLGVMINFAELSEKARLAVNVQVKLPSEEKTGLDALLQIFLERLDRASEADSMEESHSNVAFGYLAILLGNLCLTRDIRARVELKMPKCTLDPLFTAIDEFISHHHMVDAGNDDEGGTLAAFTARLGDVRRRLREGY